MANVRHEPKGGVAERVCMVVGSGDGAIIEFAELIGVSLQAAFQKRKGKHQFKQNELIAICEYYGVSANWLLLGKGKMTD